MTQTMLTPATHSVSHRETLDVAVIITFMPSDPIDVAVVEVVGDDVPVARYLALPNSSRAGAGNTANARPVLPPRCNRAQLVQNYMYKMTSEEHNP